MFVPRLLSLYQDALERGTLPESMRTHVISPLHILLPQNKSKQLQNCGNFLFCDGFCFLRLLHIHYCPAGALKLYLMMGQVFY